MHIVIPNVSIELVINQKPTCGSVRKTPMPFHVYQLEYAVATCFDLA